MQTSHETCTIKNISNVDSNVIFFFNTSHYQYFYFSTLRIVDSKLLDIPENLQLHPASDDISQKLIRFYCNGCGLKNLNQNSFKLFQSFKYIDIQHGTFTILESNLFHLVPNLRELDMTNGLLEDVSKDAFYGLTKLRVLNLSLNKLIKLEPGTFDSLVGLEYLNVSYNLIGQLENGLFSKNEKLTVYATKNQLKQIHISKNIYKLFVEENQIETITCDQDGFQIRELNIANNNLKGLGCLGSLKSLNNLNYNFNYLGKLEYTTFLNLTNLQDLSLQSTNLSGLTFGILSFPKIFNHLDLSYNSLGNIDLQAFVNMFLIDLSLEGNNLTEISMIDFPKKYLHLLKKIALGDNNFNCTYLGSLLKHLMKHKIQGVVGTSERYKAGAHINGIRCHNIDEKVKNENILLPKSKPFEKIDQILLQQFNFWEKTHMTVLNNGVLDDQIAKLQNDIQILEILVAMLITVLIVFVVFKVYYLLIVRKQSRPKILMTQRSMDSAAVLVNNN